MLGPVGNGSYFDRCSEEQWEHVSILVGDLQDRLGKGWLDDGQFSRIAEACKRYGYDHLGNEKLEWCRRDAAEYKAEHAARVAAGPPPADQLNAMIDSLTRGFIDIWADRYHGGARLIAGLADLVLSESASWDAVGPEELAAHETRLTAMKDRATKLAEDEPTPAAE
jgi:hypothetical protein